MCESTRNNPRPRCGVSAAGSGLPRDPEPPPAGLRLPSKPQKGQSMPPKKSVVCQRFGKAVRVTRERAGYGQDGKAQSETHKEPSGPALRCDGG